MPRFAVILAAAGKSSRFNDPLHKKPFAQLDQKAVWLHSAERFLNHPETGRLLIVVAPEDREDFLSRFGANVMVLDIDVVTGGELRHQSVLRGLEKAPADCDHVAVHDAARPCFNDELVAECYAAAIKHGAAIPALPVDSTVKKSTDGKRVAETVSRDQLWLAQTPQCFRRDLLEQAYARLGNRQPTDEAQAVEWAGHPVAIVNGLPQNIKITTKRDLRFASACLKSLPAPKLDARPHPFQDDTLWR